MNFNLPAEQLFRGIELKLLIKKAQQYLDTNGVILDLGCGDGRVAAILFDRKLDYGLDINQTALNSAKEKKIYKSLFMAKAEDIPLENNSVDLVFSNCTLEHIKDLDLVLNEIKRVLKRNGLFIFTVPSVFYTEYNIFKKTGFKPLIQAYGWLRNKKLNHYHIYSLSKWRNILRKYNLEIKNYYYYHSLETIYFWELLFWFNPFFRATGMRPKFIDKKIKSLISKSKSTKRKGGTLFIAAKLNEK